MKTKLSDLNEHLFAQMERLNDEDMTDEELAKEIKRSVAMSKTAQTIINGARLELDALLGAAEWNKRTYPGLLGKQQKLIDADADGT
jgi:exonuclease VII small subunit